MRESERESFCRSGNVQLGREKSHPRSEEPLFLKLGREVNRLAHSRMTTSDIDAETVKRALDTSTTQSANTSTPVRDVGTC